MHDDVTIRPADRSEADAIASMWEEAATRLKSRGINQWQYPPNREKIADDIRQGYAYLVMDGLEYLGTITVDEFADPEFWLPDDFPDDALYAHRMIVRENAAGISLGASMLDWASQKAAKMGKSWLRVDAWKTNPDLGRYYESQGFAHVRTVNLPHRRSGALYQRLAGSVTGVGPRYLGLEAWRLDENGNPDWGWTSEA
ncbi:GNAT family N-acetyltransferase [Streptomyces puniciscabiei]|uniref:GNAT family N-acetyltransferase n=1 Tax=Streptomyces puniciscabiei TaxID=164348 RepID=UPI0033232971